MFSITTSTSDPSLQLTRTLRLEPSKVSAVSEPLLSEAHHTTHVRRRKRKIEVQPPTKLEKTVFGLKFMEEVMFAILKRQPLDELAKVKFDYDEADKPQVTENLLRLTITVFNIEGMIFLTKFKWPTYYSICEMIYLNLATDIKKNDLAHVERYPLFIIQLFEKLDWDRSDLHKFYLLNVAGSEYTPAIYLKGRVGREGEIVNRLDRAILKVVQDAFELTPLKILSGFTLQELKKAETSSEAWQFGITKDVFKAAKEIIKKG